MSYFIQFLHPGGEASVPAGTNSMEWNRGRHPRKFFHHPGTCIDSDGNRAKTALTFWGEWEAECRVIDRHAKSSDGKPTLLFEPYYHKPKSYQGLTNTDPFVFGETFHYVTCQQFRNNRPTRLNNLQQGDVVLFGSCKGAQFTLDSVLVVADSILFDPADYSKKLKGKVSKVYEDVVLKTLAPDTAPVCRATTAVQDGCASSCASVALPDSATLRLTRLYYGATVDNPVNGMYSFSPCKTYQVGDWGL